MRPNDYALNAQIRTIFVQRWVDLSCLDYGVTNGVVYLRGTLRHHLGRQNSRDDEKARSEELELARTVERVLRQVRGVRDIMFQLNNVCKRGSMWLHR